VRNSVLTGAAGAGLAAVFGAVARLRPSSHALHPKGVQLSGTLHRFGSTPRWDVPWLDEPGQDSVLVRLSRAVGLPRALPDILGLAIRVGDLPAHGDLLFATTGTGTLGRFVLLPRSAEECSYTTLLPYRTPTGPVLLMARFSEGHDIELSAGTPLGPWRPFARLELPEASGLFDPPIAFDPMQNTIAGLEPYSWVRRLRAGSYAASRSARE
jgi:hypothetical protein